jgi:hypothetical protein
LRQRAKLQIQTTPRADAAVRWEPERAQMQRVPAQVKEQALARLLAPALA